MQIRDDYLAAYRSLKLTRDANGVLVVIFTVLILGSVAWLLPQWLRQGRPLAGGVWSLGWLVFALGAMIYALCLVAFLRSGGTPIIFFVRPFPPVRAR